VEFIKITVCIGSGCHVKGSRDIINKLKSFISREDMSLKLDLQACFCQNRCTEGVVVKFNDDVLENVTRDNILNILKEKLNEEA